MSLAGSKSLIISYSCSSYPTRVENTAVFEAIPNTDANFLHLHIDKATKTGVDNHSFYETNFKPKLFTANDECNGTVIKLPKTEKAILFLNLNSRSMVATSCFGSLSTVLYTSDLKWHWR